MALLASVSWPFLTPPIVFLVCICFYLIRVNSLLKSTPETAGKIAGPRWTPDLLVKTYKDLEQNPIDYTNQLPPKQDRRYIVTGGAGLVGGYLVLQLLARETPPESIRIIDIRKTVRSDLSTGQAAQVDFIQADITSQKSVKEAFAKPWESSVAHLPLTVFQTAAVIIPSTRSKYFYGFPESVNVRGTENVLDVARQAGADIFSSTSSGSIGLRLVGVFPSPWASQPRDFVQVLDESDFYEPLRPHEEFFANYTASKAVAEILVCGANSEGFRTGCIRPANGVYGNPTDNTVGGPLSQDVLFTWIPHIIQSFVHGANIAIAHLHHEAVLLNKDCPQAGKPFVVTDPNPPITFGDLYNTVQTLSVHSMRLVVMQPAILLLLSFVIEWYNLLPYRLPLLEPIIPTIKGNVKHLQPGLFTICTHIIASDAEARKPVEEGGLGYKGVLTTLQGMVLEVLEWNREHVGEGEKKSRKIYTTSVSLAEKIQTVTSRVGSGE